jgi:hypothetical protein
MSVSLCTHAKEGTNCCHADQPVHTLAQLTKVQAHADVNAVISRQRLAIVSQDTLKILSSGSEGNLKILLATEKCVVR